MNRAVCFVESLTQVSPSGSMAGISEKAVHRFSNLRFHGMMIANKTVREWKEKRGEMVWLWLERSTEDNTFV